MINLRLPDVLIYAATLLLLGCGWHTNYVFDMTDEPDETKVGDAWQVRLKLLYDPSHGTKDVWPSSAHITVKPTVRHPGRSIQIDSLKLVEASEPLAPYSQSRLVVEDAGPSSKPAEWLRARIDIPRNSKWVKVRVFSTLVDEKQGNKQPNVVECLLTARKTKEFWIGE